MQRDIDEDLIEATIRRVAESKAARQTPAADWPAVESFTEKIPIEMPVAEAIAPVVEKSPIELALERAEQAEREREAADAEPGQPEAVVEPEPVVELEPVAELEPEDDDIEVTPTPLMAASRGRGVARPAAPTPVAAAAPAPAREPIRSHEPVNGDGAIAAQLAGIKEQLEDVKAMLRQLTSDSAPSIGPAWEQAAAATAQRPQIFRDDGARQPSTDPEPDVIDTRPIPKPLPPLQVEPKRGFDLLPRSYRITVEDKRRGVDLVPLHRAMLSMEGVRDMSLLSYNNGVAIVALETVDELDPDALGAQVSRAMSRDARVEVHNEHTMVVKLAEE